jgi:hypothetical protein
LQTGVSFLSIIFECVANSRAEYLKERLKAIAFLHEGSADAKIAEVLAFVIGLVSREGVAGES